RVDRSIGHHSRETRFDKKRSKHRAAEGWTTGREFPGTRPQFSLKRGSLSGERASESGREACQGPSGRGEPGRELGDQTPWSPARAGSVPPEAPTAGG